MKTTIDIHFPLEKSEMRLSFLIVKKWGCAARHFPRKLYKPNLMWSKFEIIWIITFIWNIILFLRLKICRYVDKITMEKEPFDLCVLVELVMVLIAVDWLAAVLFETKSTVFCEYKTIPSIHASADAPEFYLSRKSNQYHSIVCAYSFIHLFILRAPSSNGI